MATSPVITAPSAPMSNFAQIGEALNTPEPSQAGKEAAAPEVEAQTEPESEAQPEVSETGEQAESAEATAAEPETAETNPYEEQEESDFKPQTLQDILKTADGKKMLANHKNLREITKAIGHAPTVEQAKAYYGAFRDQELMNEDLSSGNPQQAARLITHLFNPSRGEGAQAVASQLGAVLAKTNPEAYQAAAQPILSNYETALWTRFDGIPMPAKWEGSTKQAIYNAAQALHKDLTGKYREDILGGKTQAQPAADPLAEQRAEIEAREARITQLEQQHRESSQQQYETAINTKIGESLYAELDKALAPVKKTLEKTPRIYAALRKEFHEDVVKAAPQNRAAWDIFQVNLAKAKRSGSPEAVESVAKEYIRLVTPAITANRKKFIEEAGASAVNASERQHAELRSIESHKAPSNGGPAPKPSAGAPIERLPGESQTAFNLRQLRS